MYLRGRENIAKRVLIHTAGFNIGLMMRIKYGLRKPRSLTAGADALFLWLVDRLGAFLWLVGPVATLLPSLRPAPERKPALFAA